jgi:hypothetical protein
MKRTRTISTICSATLSFTAVNHQYGNMQGYWSALRLAEGGQIVDEYRTVGENGETYHSTTTLRAYNAVLDQWELISTDREKGLQDFGTGHLRGVDAHRARVRRDDA